MKIINSKLCRIFIIVLTVALGLSSCSFGHKDQEYKDNELGISIIVPRDWRIEEGERAHILNISPNNTQNADNSGLITILGVADYDENLLDSIRTEIARVEQISRPHEVIVSQEAEEFKADDYEAVYAKLVILQQPGDSAQNENDIDQQMDLILIRGKNQLIVLQVRRSLNDDQLNEQIDDIIDSITFIN